MKFNNSLMHLTSSMADGVLNVLFSYNFDEDKITIESVIGDYEVLENQDLFYVVRYAMLNQNYNSYVSGIPQYDEFNFDMDTFFDMTKLDRKAEDTVMYVQDEVKKFSFVKLLRK